MNLALSRIVYFIGILETVHFKEKLFEYQRDYSAFTVAELSEIVPITVNKIHLSCVKIDNLWEVSYGLNQKIFGRKNLADAMSSMLIYLIENNLVTEEWKKQWLIAA